MKFLMCEMRCENDKMKRENEKQVPVVIGKCASPHLYDL